MNENKAKNSVLERASQRLGQKLTWNPRGQPKDQLHAFKEHELGLRWKMGKRMKSIHTHPSLFLEKLVSIMLGSCAYGDNNGNFPSLSSIYLARA